MNDFEVSIAAGQKYSLKDAKQVFFGVLIRN